MSPRLSYVSAFLEMLLVCDFKISRRKGAFQIFKEPLFWEYYIYILISIHTGTRSRCKAGATVRGHHPPGRLHARKPPPWQECDGGSGREDGVDARTARCCCSQRTPHFPQDAGQDYVDAADISPAARIYPAARSTKLLRPSRVSSVDKSLRPRSGINKALLSHSIENERSEKVFSTLNSRKSTASGIKKNRGSIERSSRSNRFSINNPDIPLRSSKDGGNHPVKVKRQPKHSMSLADHL